MLYWVVMGIVVFGSARQCGVQLLKHLDEGTIGLITTNFLNTKIRIVS